MTHSGPAASLEPSPRQVVFLLLPHVHLLDLAGAAQVFYEAGRLGGSYRVRFCGAQARVRSAQGLWLAGLEPLPAVGPRDRVLVAGIDSATLGDLSHVPREWLRSAYAAGAEVGSICSGAFALAAAGLLDGKRCTTHWQVLERLAESSPGSEVLANRLFVRDGRIVTSAGVASGIDMALAMVEEDHGPLVMARVARELVVYLRREGRDQQISVYLDYRAHLHPGIHRVQDWITTHPDERPTIDELSRIAAMSPRNLTRVFKQATGITLKEFSTRLKLEVAKNLLRNRELTVDEVASRCGFEDPRQLRRLWKLTHGLAPSAWRESAGEAS